MMNIEVRKWKRRLAKRKRPNDTAKMRMSRGKRAVSEMAKGRGRNHGIARAFVPCAHDGPCTKENGCTCVFNDHFCSKYCACPQSCTIAFPGCRCKGVCATLQCPCFSAGRECDPDLCGMCGSDIRPGAANECDRSCRNSTIQLGDHKHLMLAPSLILGAGWGIFTKKAIPKDEYIHEYVGEIISQEEAERRGRVYDRVRPTKKKEKRLVFVFVVGCCGTHQSFFFFFFPLSFLPIPLAFFFLRSTVLICLILIQTFASMH